MKIKKFVVLLFSILVLAGCQNLNKMSYDDIVNTINLKANGANTFRRGYKFFLPKGLTLTDAGANYAIISSNNFKYYLFIDLAGYNEKVENTFEGNNNSHYFRLLNSGDKSGYVEISLQQNDEYLIEIMYNYAKIEVMVEKSNINKALANSISVLRSVKYDSDVIAKMLEDDNLTSTEEVFDLFEKAKNNSNVLNYIEESNDNSLEEEIVDTDYIN